MVSVGDLTRIEDWDVDIPPPPPLPVSWRRALRALRELLQDPDCTEKAFEVFIALDGQDEEHYFQRFRAHPAGRALLRERPVLLDRLSNRSALAQLPPDSFGAAYLAYLERTGFAPDGLLQLKAGLEARAASTGEQVRVLDPAREWFRVRGLLSHDLWHVLTGYGTDPEGETQLLAFTLAQLPGRFSRVVTIGAGLRCVRQAGLGFARSLQAAWLRGHRAVWLPALPYEALLPLPLAEVRAQAKLG
jgi:ubiquinone biosynthesis protein COQ4